MNSTATRTAFGFLFLLFGVVAALTPAQNDTFWHLRAGADIWATHAIPRIDHYSHTAAGAPWPDHEWLSQVLMYLVYRVGGMPGLGLGAAAIILATAALTYRLMVGPPVVKFLLLAVGLSVSSVTWVLRPQIVTLLAIALLLTLLARDRHRWIPLPFLIWANAHGGVALGGLVLIAGAAAAVLRWWRSRSEVDRRRVLTLAVVLPLAGLATAATPLGFGIYRFVIDSFGRSAAAHISEWAPPVPTNGAGAMFWAVALGFVVLLVVRRRTLAVAKSSWADWAALAVSLALLPLAVRSLRNIGPFLIVATAAASRLLGDDLALRFPAASPPVEPVPGRAGAGRGYRLLVVPTIAAVIGLIVAWRKPLPILNWRPIGDAALVAVRACPGPLYNRYDEGGYLIWFAPETPVFVDGRQDPYTPAFLAEEFEIEMGGPHRPLFDRYGVRCAFLPADAGLAGRLQKEGWRATHTDAQWTVLVAPGAK